MTEPAPKLYVVAPLSYPSLRTRLPKIMGCYEAAGFDVAVTAWRRSPDDTPSTYDNSHDIGHILRGGGYSTRWLPGFYLAWMIRVALWCLRTRPARVHALGFESAYPIALVKLIRPWMHVVYDDADRFSQAFPMPNLARQLIARLERWTARRVDIHVIPNEQRYLDGLSAQSVVLPNVPTEDVVRRAAEVDVETAPGPGLTVYVNGWLGKTRGAGMLAEAAAELEGEVTFLVAGRTSDEEARRFTSRPGVRYLGIVPNEVALAQYRAADITVTLYDPALRINRLAEANKWGDCLVTGTPFIVNSEVETARSYVEAGSAVTVPFGDVRGLVRILRELNEDRGRLEAMTECVRMQGRDVVPFEALYTIRVVDKILAGG